MTWKGLTPPYATIVADPPWRYRSSAITTKGAAGYHASHRKPTAQQHYSTMTMAEVAALPVEELAAEDAYLLLWVTNPRLFGDRGRNQGPAPVDILERWGFGYVTTVTWVKTGQLGMGYHFRVQTEHALVGVRGKAKVPPEARERNLIVAARNGHSGKPPAFYDMAERCLQQPYLELFARQPRLGWDSWGWGYEGATA